MTEYVAKCWADEDDTITASRAGESVELMATRNGRHMMEAYLYPAAVRTFARGLLTLADEIDGGEEAAKAVKAGDRIRILIDGAEYANVSRGDVFDVKRVANGLVTVDDKDGGYWYFRDKESYEKVNEPAIVEPIKVGDTIRVLEDNANGATVRRGDTFVVRHVNDHEVQVDGDGVRGRWYLSLTNVEKVVAPADEPIRVGDRVTIVRGENSCSNGTTGIVGEIDTACRRLPYRIVDEAGDYVAWAAEVRKVDEPEPVFVASRIAVLESAPIVDAERVALVEAAQKQCGGLADTADVLAMARFLAGE